MVTLLFSFSSLYAGKNYYCLKDGENSANNTYACMYILFMGWRCDKEEPRDAGNGDCAGNRHRPIEKPKDKDVPEILPGF